MASAGIDNEHFKNIVTTSILFILLVLTFLVLRPILLSVIMGMILVVVFSPPYDWLLKKTKSKIFSLSFICVFIILLVVLPFWFLVPIFVKQSFEFYVAAQHVDFVQLFAKIFPSVSPEQISTEFGSVFSGFVTRSLNALVNSFAEMLLNFPTIFLQLIVVFATFFFVLKDKDEIMNFVRSLMPFSKDVEKKLIQSSTDITISVVYGQIVIGIIQGLIVGFGFLIFGVPKTIFLTLLAVIAGILPIIGPTIIWIPVVLYLLSNGNTFAAAGVAVFGVISFAIDHFVRPYLITKSSKMHPLLSLIGMTGGFFFFGVLGFLLGPLILAYVIIILEVYRGKELQGFFLKQQ